MAPQCRRRARPPGRFQDHPRRQWNHAQDFKRSASHRRPDCRPDGIRRGHHHRFDATAVVAKQQRIRANAQSGEAGFSELPAGTKAELLKRQDELLKTLDGRDYSQLSEQQRAQAQENIAWIDGVAQQAADERRVCERVKPVGTNRTERVCRTAEQVREDREKPATRCATATRGIDNVDWRAR